MNSMISNYTPKMQRFLSYFTQRFENDMKYWDYVDILNNPSYWVKSIPHPHSGSCSTYNPQRQSNPGYWFHMLIVPNIDIYSPDYSEDRRNWFNHGRIYLHEPGNFYFSREEEAPNNIGLDLKRVQLMNRTRIVGN